MTQAGTPPPRTVIGDPSRAGALGRNCPVSLATCVHCAGRRTTPSGTTPSRTSRHRAIRSLRAKATIIVLRVPRAFSVRARNHCAKALFFWNRRNRHANWIMPRRTRALPERASPHPAREGHRCVSARRQFPDAPGPCRHTVTLSAVTERNFPRQASHNGPHFPQFAQCKGNADKKRDALCGRPFQH